MRRPLVAGNWKMHGSLSTTRTLLADLEQRLEPQWPIDVAVFPPYVYLADAARILDQGRSSWGRRMCAPRPAAPSPAR